MIPTKSTASKQPKIQDSPTSSTMDAQSSIKDLKSPQTPVNKKKNCWHCAKVLASYDNLRNHLKYHCHILRQMNCLPTRPGYPCSYCNTFYSTPVVRLRHEKSYCAIKNYALEGLASEEDDGDEEDGSKL
jgi:hypothetical protein